MIIFANLCFVKALERDSEDTRIFPAVPSALSEWYRGTVSFAMNQVHFAIEAATNARQGTDLTEKCQEPCWLTIVNGKATCFAEFLINH